MKRIASRSSRIRTPPGEVLAVGSPGPDADEGRGRRRARAARPPRSRSRRGVVGRGVGHAVPDLDARRRRRGQRHHDVHLLGEGAHVDHGDVVVAELFGELRVARHAVHVLILAQTETELQAHDSLLTAKCRPSLEVSPVRSDGHGRNGPGVAGPGSGSRGRGGRRGNPRPDLGHHDPAALAGLRRGARRGPARHAAALEGSAKAGITSLTKSSKERRCCGIGRP